MRTLTSAPHIGVMCPCLWHCSTVWLWTCTSPMRRRHLPVRFVQLLYLYILSYLSLQLVKRQQRLNSPQFNSLSQCILLGCFNWSVLFPCIQALEASVFVFFVLEMLMKMVALGVYGQRTSYLSNRWNKLDVFINCGKLVSHNTNS